jgi:hypothetical protein
MPEFWGRGSASQIDAVQLVGTLRHALKKLSGLTSVEEVLGVNELDAADLRCHHVENALHDVHMALADVRSCCSNTVPDELEMPVTRMATC